MAGIPEAPMAIVWQTSTAFLIPSNSGGPFNFYFSKSGSNSNPGTLSSPWHVSGLILKESIYRGKTIGMINEDGTIWEGCRTFDTTYSLPVGGTTWNCSTSAQLTTALVGCADGDVIVLTAGTTFNGTFTLRNRGAGTGWVYIISSAMASLPAPGTRVAPSDSANMPKIECTSGSASNMAIQWADGAARYRFAGIWVGPVTGQYQTTLIGPINQITVLSNLPDHIYFDRCYIHSDVTAGGRRGIAMDCTYFAVIDSYMDEFKENGADTQCVWTANSPGPFRITNNYLEAAGENFMFGGAVPPSLSAAFLPHDIEIRGNYLFKPAAWFGSVWSIKNSGELKLGIRAMHLFNKMDGSWTGGQHGYSFLITPRDEDPGNGFPAAQVSNVFFGYNRAVNVDEFMQISGADDGGAGPGVTSQATSNVWCHGNFADLRNQNTDSGRGWLMLMYGYRPQAPDHVEIEHNTIFTRDPGGGGSACFFSDDDGNGPHADHFLYRNNLVRNGSNGWSGTSTNEPDIAIWQRFATNYIFKRNVQIDLSESGQGQTNFDNGTNGGLLSPAVQNSAGWGGSTLYPSAYANVGFNNFAGGDYSLAVTSPYKNGGTDGLDIGCDFSLIPP